MSERQRRTGAVATAATGVGLLGGAAALGPTEHAINRRVTARNDRRRERLMRPFGYDEQGRPAADPRARARASGFTPSRETKEAAAALKRRKYGMLNEFNRTRPRGIPLNSQLGRKWALVGTGGLLAWGGGRQLVDKRVTRNDVDAAAAGGTAGVVGHLGLHYARLPADRRAERKIADDLKMSLRLRHHRNEVGLPSNAGKGHPAYLQYFRRYPLDLPGGRAKRVLSYTHGGRSGALVAGGLGLMGAGTAVHGRRQHVSKALYAREERVSPLRAAELGAGLALGAWGAGRSKMIGAALGHGVRIASARGSDRALEALKLAQVAQGTLRRSTRPGERAVRQIQAVDRAVRAVPRPLRGDVATAAGILLAANASPVRRERYSPVSRPLPVRPVGW